MAGVDRFEATAPGRPADGGRRRLRLRPCLEHRFGHRADLEIVEKNLRLAGTIQQVDDDSLEVRTVERDRRRDDARRIRASRSIVGNMWTSSSFCQRSAWSKIVPGTITNDGALVSGSTSAGRTTRP